MSNLSLPVHSFYFYEKSYIFVIVPKVISFLIIKIPGFFVHKLLSRNTLSKHIINFFIETADVMSIFACNARVFSGVPVKQVAGDQTGYRVVGKVQENRKPLGYMVLKE